MQNQHWGWVGITLTCLTPPHCCACLKPSVKFPLSYLVLSESWWGLIARFLGIGEIVEHLCCIFLIITWFEKIRNTLHYQGTLKFRSPQLFRKWCFKMHGMLHLLIFFPLLTFRSPATKQILTKCRFSLLQYMPNFITKVTFLWSLLNNVLYMYLIYQYLTIYLIIQWPKERQQTRSTEHYREN